MATMIQIRNVPDAIHREVKARAAKAGMSLSDYLLQQLERIVEHPTREETLARIAELPRVELTPDAATLVRAERDAR